MAADPAAYHWSFPGKRRWTTAVPATAGVTETVATRSGPAPTAAAGTVSRTAGGLGVGLGVGVGAVCTVSRAAAVTSWGWRRSCRTNAGALMR